MSAPAEIIEKIKKLLRLARSSNPHEAQLALARAMALAREHSVAIDGLNPDEAAKEKTVTHEDTEPTLRLSYDKEYAVRVCQLFFRITPVFRTSIVMHRGWPTRAKRVSFVGTRTDIAIALYVYGFLLHHFAFCWRKHKGRLRNRHAFVDGMFRGIARTLMDAEPAPTERDVNGTELMVADHSRYIDAHIGKTTDRAYGAPDHNAQAALNAGWIEGRNTVIAKPLTPAAAAPLTLK